jgi:hypothetical protein
VPPRRPRQADANRIAGARFEAMLVHRAHLCGYLPIKQHLTFRYLKGGRVLAMRAELDFSLVGRAGQVAFVDTKSFDASRVPKSALDRNQVARAYRYNLWNVPAGFVVELRRLGRVVFFTGRRVHLLRAGESLGLADGVDLGPAETFALDGVFTGAQALGLQAQLRAEVVDGPPGVVEAAGVGRLAP